MLTKNMTVTEMSDSGKGLALIANLSAVDHDGDTYAPGAFAWKEQWAPLLTAHDRWGMPFGKARVYEEGDAAYAELHLNLDTAAGRDWHAALKFDLATGKSVQEWSYGYDVLDADLQFRGLEKIRMLKKLDIHEVSTVVRGAGQGTGTVSMKARNAALKEGRFDGLLGELGTMAEVLKGDPGLLSATGRKQLGDIHAAMGAALVLPPETGAEEKAAVNNAVAAELQRISRRHLKQA
ncbi:HK97 family phage prohead protease [Allopontixanthobacter sp.]|uniref:HK97 family phage prohead protease n=1 Tax=Allopontixanthobacter sp. TaxID=2906452 RepID=UPI002ABC1468|nr:HK97 family phage prohead protease [Allopontixanthobacter sp.]MDZ4307552.1 HK97 family phage prohead protease [Allopontixanthobacter sp.]